MQAIRCAPSWFVTRLMIVSLLSYGYDMISDKSCLVDLRMKVRIVDPPKK